MSFSKGFDGGAWPCSSIHCEVIRIGASAIFGILSAVVEWAGKRLGAAVIGLNPLHALKNTKPYHMSPYSPTSRSVFERLCIST